MDEEEFNDISDNDDAGFEIKKHDFEQYKEAIRAFANKAETPISIGNVNSKKDVGEWFAEWLKGGGIGGDHKVTGKEFNDLVGEVQGGFIDTSKNIRNIMSGFMKVYDTFESLDNDYIKSILVNVKRIDGECIERSEEVKKLASCIKELKSQLDAFELEKKRSDAEKISEVTESTHAMKKKIRFAYIVAGSSLGLTLIELIIIITKVIF